MIKLKPSRFGHIVRRQRRSGKHRRQRDKRKGKQGMEGLRQGSQRQGSAGAGRGCRGRDTADVTHSWSPGVGATSRACSAQVVTWLFRTKMLTSFAR